jgi:hypothetical protein
MMIRPFSLLSTHFALNLMIESGGGFMMLLKSHLSNENKLLYII